MTSNSRFLSLVGVTLLSLIVVTLGAVALATLACGGDPDPLAEKCTQVCQVAETDPCGQGNFRAQCVADCRALSGEAAAKGYKGEACGTCIAGLFKYSGKRCKGDQICDFFGDQETCGGQGCTAQVETCYGVKGPTGMDVPQCKDLCVEED